MHLNLLGTVFRNMLRGKANWGLCPICDGGTFFIELDSWLRDHYLCIRCRSIPRNRALIHFLTAHFPDYRSYSIHESSPSGPASERIARDCPGYIPTQYFPDIPPGALKDGVRCENLECMTFPDESLDLVITQDVLEHVMHPDKAFAEIARTLRPGGAHLFTIPLYPRKQSLVRAVEHDGVIEYLVEPDYHGNPIDENGSLVAREWGEEIVDYIDQHSGMKTEVHRLIDRRMGMDGEFMEVLISRKAD